MNADNWPRMNADISRTRPSRGSAEEYPHWELTQKIIGAAFQVHGELGPGFLEKVYETALLQELSESGVQAQPQLEIGVKYKRRRVGTYFADILVDNKVICEVKAVQALSSAHEAQLLHYLKATDSTLGLLLNFGADRLQFKRLVLSK